MKVYLVETGLYEDRDVAGVYASVEAAMAAHPPRREGIVGDPQKGQCERPGGWQRDEWGDWDNGLDWNDAASIAEWEVEG